ncbi:MAG: Zn-binding domain-containing protein [Acidimicrobiales bacterium]
MFEVASCRKCGVEYLVGSLGNEQHFGLVRTIDTPIYLLPAEGLTEGAEDEDDSASAVVAESDEDRRDELCVRCGVLCEPGQACGCSSPERELVLRLIADNEDGALRSCPSCGGRSNASIVSRVLTGSEAPVAVIATSLYQALPPASGEAADNIGAGRKLLSFADSVQDAAFFAPYLSRTYGRAVQRRLIWQVLSKDDGPEPLASLATRLRKRAELEQVLDDDKASLNRATVLHWLTAEALSVDRRQSLDGVGLAELTVDVPSRVSTPPALKRIGLTDDEARDLARLLLDSLRLAAAVIPPEDVDMKDPIFSPRNIVTQVHQMGTEYGLLSWSPSRGMNRRLDYLTKVLAALGSEADPRELLDDLWTEWFTRPGGAWEKVLVRQNHRKHGTVYALDHEALTLQAAGPDHQPFRCDTCRQLWWRSIRGVCPTYRCPGTLGPAELDDQDHYRHLYTEVLPIGMRSEEHTGQLETQYAATLQQEFIDGEVNVLSCSTTFELGVDVGEVQAVLMRNVPPSPANYVQRAGRAGRRAGSAALVVTFAQRRNHDLHYFAHPRDMVDGIVSPPIIEIRNPNIARRHLHAVAFAAFLRDLVDSGDEPAKDVAGFFMPAGTSHYERFVEWMRSRPDSLVELLDQSIPADLHRSVGLDDWSWVDQLVEINAETGAGWLTRAASDVRGDLQLIQQTIDDAIANDQLNRVSPLDRIRRTLSSRQLIQVLAQSGVLPKYGFPVDVAMLDLARSTNPKAAKLDLTRDLSQAVSMYAPGNQIVASGVMWEPIALKRPPNGDFVRRWWGRCRDCEAFQVLLDLGGDDDPTCRVCNSTTWKSRGKFVVPSLGFIGEASGNKPGERRPPTTATSSTFFDRYEGADPEPQLLAIGPGPSGTVELRHSRQAWITVISRPKHGHGFLLCNFCGALRDKPPATKKKSTEPEPHDKPTGFGECDGHFHMVNLGHQYLTDAIELRLNPGAVRGENAIESTLHALLAATRAVGITRDDMQGSTQPFAPQASPAIVLFDGVPGGAGHAEHLAKNLPALFEAALDLVTNSECGEETSCYGCLRTYRNQFSHDQLVRAQARDTLAAVLGVAPA